MSIWATTLKNILPCSRVTALSPAPPRRRDHNLNGIAQVGELKALGELGITSISTTQTRVSQPTASGNNIIATGSHIRNGQQQYVTDIEFAYDPAMTDAHDNQWRQAA